MSEYLKFATEKEAGDCSRSAWENVLGRKKNPEDITEFLWSPILPPDKSAALIEVSAETKKHLTAGDAAKLVAATDSSVKPTLDAVEAARPAVPSKASANGSK